MPNTLLNEPLQRLISTLNPSEKRYFKLYSQRNRSSNSDLQFISLFNVLDKHQSKDPIKIEKKVYQTLSNLTPKKYSDLKRHLYKQLLECLRIYNKNNHSFIIPTKIEMAKTLYSKGLFLDSLEILKKTKKRALEQQSYILAYEIVSIEMDIESRHVTRSHSKRAKELILESKKIRTILATQASWSTFSLELYDRFLQIGHIKNEEDYNQITTYFNKSIPRRSINKDHFLEVLYHSKAHLWYNYITLNFTACFKYSLKWVKLFDRFPNYRKTHPHLHIKGLHNVLSVLFYCLDQKRHNYYLKELEDLVAQNKKSHNQNTQQMSFIYLHSAKLNEIFLSGKFSESKRYLKRFEKELSEMSTKMDDHRLMVFWYKMGSVYFTFGDYKNCNRLLNKIINDNQKTLREDIQCFARLLRLIAHFEMGETDFLSYLIRSTYRFLIKMNDTTKIHETIIKFLRNSLYENEKTMKKSFIRLKKDLEKLNERKFESRSFLYLDIVSWLESKIENKSVEAIIKRKRSITK